ncbi:MAG: putative transporter ATP-binding protein [Phycisphaerales bacterium]|nr:putative transporter ATP-binding protein [Phycisphaerales bacterium]
MHAAEVIRRLFALPERTEPLAPVPAAAVEAAWPLPGEITLITGGSGGGKSRLLAALHQRGGPAVRWIEPHTIELGDACVVDLLCDELDGPTPVPTQAPIPAGPPADIHEVSAIDAASRVSGHDPTRNRIREFDGDRCSPCPAELNNRVNRYGKSTAGPAGEQAHVPAIKHGVAPADRNAPEDPADSRIEAALELLSRVGLAEAWTYLQKPSELSDGQRWRLRLAMAVASGLRRPAGASTPPWQGSPSYASAPRIDSTVTTIIAIDEFAALLDRVTARVVARALRRLIDRPGRPPMAAIVVTSHDDLRLALSPDRRVLADFGAYQAGDGEVPGNGVVKYRKRPR